MMTNNIKKSEKNAQQGDQNDLLCCPFCGRAAFYWIVYRNCWKISCENDCITMPSRFDTAFTSKEQARKRWNQRKGITKCQIAK